ncbi:hypothetical protein POJ06DRAFT_252679 [Lipomyces tetrasporus]|uniref:Secreted protein n=1 Tax=Lipomyces tetrasporus TaxID=54092 RepID=A0AAD7QS97_9ASCO|nr:uncharacterized protein POJ06DRAFT_252679 [Lipomyces tetrasporus]KAJ8100425.1 hypothetical protein POJ06DRAFT_252679 [Lipomyces tetrasporus]
MLLSFCILYFDLYLCQCIQCPQALHWQPSPPSQSSPDPTSWRAYDSTLPNHILAPDCHWTPAQHVQTPSLRVQVFWICLCSTLPTVDFDPY